MNEMQNAKPSKSISQKQININQKILDVLIGLGAVIVVSGVAIFRYVDSLPKVVRDQFRFSDDLFSSYSVGVGIAIGLVLITVCLFAKRFLYGLVFLGALAALLIIEFLNFIIYW